MKPAQIDLDGSEPIPILYEDRAALAIDKPRGWMLAPVCWQKTSRNLQLILTSSIRAGDFWARSRSLKFIRFVHRLDAETTGVLLFAKSPGALAALSRLFEGRQVKKLYLGVVFGTPPEDDWVCKDPLAEDPRRPGRVWVNPRQGKEAETHFRVLARNGSRALVAARPLTGRTHQIRVHLAAASLPILGDPLYGNPRADKADALALRSIGLAYPDPFHGRPVQIRADLARFLEEFGFASATQWSRLEELWLSPRNLKRNG